MVAKSQGFSNMGIELEKLFLKKLNPSKPSNEFIPSKFVEEAPVLKNFRAKEGIV